jgi:hypothetical protein
MFRVGLVQPAYSFLQVIKPRESKQVLSGMIYIPATASDLPFYILLNWAHDIEETPRTRRLRGHLAGVAGHLAMLCHLILCDIRGWHLAKLLVYISVQD